MSIRTMPSGGSATLQEMRAFAGFPAASQRFICRSLDVAFDRGDAAARWSRDPHEAAAIVRQRDHYAYLEPIRKMLPSEGEQASLPGFFGALVTLSARDLAEDRLGGFSSYLFLYERLLGSRIRPWLVPGFLAAAVVPAVPPVLRRRLLQTMREREALATIWPSGEPGFLPEWIDTSCPDEVPHERPQRR